MVLLCIRSIGLNWYASQSMAIRVLVLMAALIVVAFVIQRAIS
jgi:hypothetical protein